MFLHDVYHEQNIIKGLIPAERIFNNSQYRPAGHQCRTRYLLHISGIDIVRAGEGEFYVLEDNLRACRRAYRICSKTENDDAVVP